MNQNPLSQSKADTIADSLTLSLTLPQTVPGFYVSAV